MTAGPAASRRWSVLVLAGCAGCAAPADRVELSLVPGGVAVRIDGEPFATYRPGDPHRSRPCLFPVFGAAGRAMTRSYPLGPEVDGEEAVDPHHTGIWIAPQVAGTDLWNGPDQPGGGRIVQESLQLRDDAGRLECRNRYEDRSGRTICTEERRLTFAASDSGRAIDVEVSLAASHGPVSLPGTGAGFLAIRLPATLQLRGRVARGAAVTSEGVTGAAASGSRGTWADVHGWVDGELVGVAIFDHPENPGHPARWLIREDGLFAVQPSGPVAIQAGGSRRFRFRLFFHRGDAAAARVAEHYRRFATPDGGPR